MSRIFEGSAVGVSFEPAKSNLIACAALGVKDLTLKHMPENEFDANAVAVLAGSRQIGWVPKPYNLEVLKYGTERVVAEFKGWNSYGIWVVGVTILLKVGK